MNPGNINSCTGYIAWFPTCDATKFNRNIAASPSTTTVVDPSSGFTPTTTPSASDHASLSGSAPIFSRPTTGFTIHRCQRFATLPAYRYTHPSVTKRLHRTLREEPIRLSLLRTPRRIYRVLALAAVFAYSILEVLITRPRTRALRAAWLSRIGNRLPPPPPRAARLSRIGNRLLRTQDITFTTIGPIPSHGAVITNHLTYVDVIIHGAMRPCVFVSKIELRK